MDTDGSEVPLAEFIELHNTDASVSFDTNGWRFTKGVNFTMPEIEIAPGGYLVIAANLSTFTAIHPGVTNVIGGWSGKLANSGERIKLVGPAGEPVDEVSYSDQGDWAQRSRDADEGWVWQTAADGGRRSLELIDCQLENDLGSNWGSSASLQGTPGAANSIDGSHPTPLISDIRHHPAVPSSSQTLEVSANLHGVLPPGGEVRLNWIKDADDSIFPMLVANIPRASEDGRIPQLMAFFQNPIIRKKYFREIESLLTNEFSKLNLDSMIDNLLRDWVSPEDITDVITYADERRQFMLESVNPPLE